MPNETGSSRASLRALAGRPGLPSCFPGNPAKYTVDIYRCYELWQLAAEASKLACGLVLEIGVWRGGTTRLLAKRFTMAGVTDRFLHATHFAEWWAPDQRIIGIAAGSIPIRVSEWSNPYSRSWDWRTFISFPHFSTKHRRPHCRSLSGCAISMWMYVNRRGTRWIGYGRKWSGGIVVFDDYGFSFCEGITSW